MTVRTLVGAIALSALTLAPSMAVAQTPKVDDTTLDNKIEARLKANPTLKHDNIDVTVEDGVVTLNGKVASSAHRDRAAVLAKIAGVTRVDNKLEIDKTLAEKVGTAGYEAKDKSDRALDKAKDKSERAADKVKDKSEKAKDKADRAADKSADKSSGAGEAITDAWITTKIKADFINEDTLKGSEINVDTDNHVVTLKGTVLSAAGRARAVEVAKGTKGVARVIDTLTISPKKK